MAIKESGKKNAAHENTRIVTWNASVPSFDSKDGRLTPNNRFQIAFGDEYCIDCKGMNIVYFHQLN